LDYDYTERMDLVELSIYVNRELNRSDNGENCKESKVLKGSKESRVSNKDKDGSDTKGSSSRGILTKSRMVNSRTAENNTKPLK
jgi:hypothetical protein